MTASSRVGPLTHLRVLDLSRMYPGAYATSMLADLGADVWKIEAPKFGDGMRFITGGFEAQHVALNRGKRSMTLDLRQEGSADVLRRLVRDADVVVESHRPGALAAQGVGYEQLRTLNPGLVWCAITGFGQSGPNALAPGHDITYLGAAGALSRLSAPDVTPTPPQLTVSIPVGALMAVTGILAALAQRDRTGNGSYIDTSLTDAAMWMVSEDVARAAVAPAPSWPDMAARWVYRCADGRSVTVAATEAKSWAALVAALDVPDLADPRHAMDGAATIERLAAAFATKPAAAWCETPGFAGGVGPSYEPVDLLDDAHVAARAGIATIDGSGERVLASPMRISGADGESRTATTPAPDLGADTDELLAVAGFDAGEIAALREAKII